MSDRLSGARPPSRLMLIVIAAVSAALVFLVASLLTSIFQRKQEGRNPYVRLVDVSEETTDPGAVGHQLVARVRRLQAHRRSDPDAFRWIGSPPCREGRRQSLADTDVRGLCVRHRLSRSARPRVHAAGPGGDAAGHRTQAAGCVPPVPHVGHPDLPAARRRRRLQGLRCAQQAAPTARRTPRL